jgi:hypothetical protein
MKIAEYLKGSSTRLSMMWGLIGSIICCFSAIIAWIFASIEPNGWIAAICGIPGIIGCLPYILNTKGKIKEILDGLPKK